MALPLRLATFNLESLDDRPGRQPSLEARIAVLRPRLVQLAADVVCLQEVNAQHPPGGGPRKLLALERLLESTPYAGYARATTEASDNSGLADVHNLVILSRFPITRCRPLRHDLVAPPLYGAVTASPPSREKRPIEWDRPVLAAEIQLPGGRRLHVINLHLRAPLAAPISGQKESSSVWKSVAGWAEGFFLATVKRSGQALEARLLIDSIFDRDAKALVAVLGDFNAEAREMPLRTIRGETGDTGNPHLDHRALIPLEQSLPESQRFTVLHEGHRAMLDHVLVSRALFAHYQHVEVHNEELDDEVYGPLADPNNPASFHAPMVAEFALPEMPSA